MKKFKKALEAIDVIRAELKAAEKEKADFLAGFKGLPIREKAGKLVENEEIISAYDEKIVDHKIKLEICKNNAKIALFEDTAPTIAGAFQKFANKPYGEKTREKIKSEIYSATGCYVHISDDYGLQKISVSPSHKIYEGIGYEYDIDLMLKYKDGQPEQKLLIGNKIQPFSADDLEVCYISGEFVMDLDKRVSEIKELHKKACTLQAELQSVCEKYNQKAVGLKPLRFSDYIYPMT